MLRSMTGFGAAQGQFEGVEYAVEARSVNHRYFKAVVKLPEIWSAAEVEVEKLLRSRVNRGSATLAVRMKVSEEQAAYDVNTVALGRYLDQLKEMVVDANPTLRIDLGSMLQLPGVCEPPLLEEICRRTREGLMGLISSAVDALMEMRQQEGRAIEQDLRDHCETVTKAAAVIADRAPRVVQEYHDRLAARVQELVHGGKLQIDAEILAREVAIFAERCDVTEEISRLTAHVDHFRGAMGSAEPAGRKLEFIAQEMLREANTIASKANDAEIARSVVEMKTGIDRIKEQVQNVE